MTHPPTSSLRAVSKYIEDMDARAARTQQLCAEQPYQQAVRTALLRAEKDVHFNEGWNIPPRVFVLNRHTKNDRITYSVVDKWSQAFVNTRTLTPDVLLNLADAAEITRRVAGWPAAERSDVQREAFRDMGLVGPGPLSPDADLTTNLPPNWSFHGVGLLCEGYTVFNTGNLADRKAVDALADEGNLYTHSARVEIREALFYDRHGVWWELIRVRRTADVNVPRYCTAQPHSQDARSGDVPHALSRICNAIAGNPVPILPRHRDEPGRADIRHHLA